jgi:hypothetical protein
MVWDRDEWVENSSPTTSAMFAVMQMFYARQEARGFWQESYTICVDKLIEARVA